jgi:hypothetical protein
MGQLLKAGSVMRVGIAYNYEHSSLGVEAERQGPSWLRSALLTQLQSLGVFSAINIDVKPPAYLGFQDGYITIQVTLSDDQASPQDVAGMIQYAVTAYALGITVERMETAIDYVAPGSVAQVTPQPQTNANQPLPPGACRWETMSFGDYVACQLGITSPFSGMAVGTVGALVGVGVVTLLAVVLLKR